MVTFTTELLALGNNVGIEVPEDIVLGFGAGKRVPVIVTIEGYTYPSPRLSPPPMSARLSTLSHPSRGQPASCRVTA